MVVLSGLFWISISQPVERFPIFGMRVSMEETAMSLQQRRELARDSIVRVKKQLEIEEQMLAIRERAVNHCYAADLLFERAMCQNYWDKLEQGLAGTLGPADFVRLEQPLSSAMEHFQKALDLPPPYGHQEEVILVMALSLGAKRYADRIYIEARMADIQEIQGILKGR
jgi:hypothetical protein